MSSRDLISRPEPEYGFNYNSLTPEIQREARSAARRIREHLKRAATDIGRELVAAKAMLPHGSFADWVRLEFRMEPRTAQNYMSVANAFGDKCETVAYLPPSTLFALSRKSTPPEARTNLLARIKAGGRPGEAEVLDLIRISKAPPSRPVPDVDVGYEAPVPPPSIAVTQRETDELARALLGSLSAERLLKLNSLLRTDDGGKQLSRSLEWLTAEKAKAVTKARTDAIVADAARRKAISQQERPALIRSQGSSEDNEEVEESVEKRRMH